MNSWATRSSSSVVTPGAMSLAASSIACAAIRPAIRIRSIGLGVLHLRPVVRGRRGLPDVLGARDRGGHGAGGGDGPRDKKRLARHDSECIRGASGRMAARELPRGGGNGAVQEAYGRQNRRVVLLPQARKVEEGPECRAADRFGPYDSREEAAHAMETARERNLEWENDPKWHDAGRARPAPAGRRIWAPAPRPLPPRRTRVRVGLLAGPCGRRLAAGALASAARARPSGRRTPSASAGPAPAARRPRSTAHRPPRPTSVRVVRAAIPPTRTWPSCGPTEYDSSSMPASRPRSSSGIVWFHIAERKMPLTMSQAPASVRNSSTSRTSCSCPAAVIASPHPAAASATARPCRWTRDVQPLVRLTRKDPAGNAAYINPSAQGASRSSARKGKIASGKANTIAVRSTA